MAHFLEFERPIAELEGKIAELRHMSSNGDLNIAEEILKIQSKVDKLLRQTYSRLGAWQKAQVARHPDRPHCIHYIQHLITDYLPLAGDRAFAEDKAILTGIGRFRGQSVIVIGQEKGSDTASRVKHNFGMARPEGYRKAIRLMEMADHFAIPVISFVDTPGAFPGIDAEARGQAEAIARAIETCLKIRVPLLSIVIGEGGSGGAIAIAAGNYVAMLEHAIYSVISPEGCASILWRSADQAKEAAEALKLTAEDLKEVGVIDEIIPEPLGGAHRNVDQVMAAVSDSLARKLKDFSSMSGQDLRDHRRQKFLAMGRHV